MTIDWRDPKTIAAVETYVRLAVGSSFVAVVLYMFLIDRIDLSAVLKALGSILAIDRIGIGAIGILRARNRETIE